MGHQGTTRDGPLVSVIVPTFNRRRYLREALIEHVRRDGQFRREFDREAKALTLRVIDGLGLADNV